MAFVISAAIGRADGITPSRLGDVAGLRRPGEVLFARQRHQVLQLTNVHQLSAGCFAAESTTIISIGIVRESSFKPRFCIDSKTAELVGSAAVRV